MTTEPGFSPQEITTAFLQLVEAIAAGHPELGDELADSPALSDPRAVVIAAGIAADALNVMEDSGVVDSDALFGMLFSRLGGSAGEALPAEALRRMLRLVRFVRCGLTPTETIPVPAQSVLIGLGLIAVQAAAAPLSNQADIPGAVAALAARNRPVPAVPPTDIVLRYGPDVPADTGLKAMLEPPGRNDRCWCGTGERYKRCHGLLPPEASAHLASLLWHAGAAPVVAAAVLMPPGIESPAGLEGPWASTGIPILLIDKRTDPSLEETFRRVEVEQPPDTRVDTGFDTGFDTEVKWSAAFGTARLQLRWSAPVSHEVVVVLPMNSAMLSWFEQIGFSGTVTLAATGPEGAPDANELSMAPSVTISFDKVLFGPVLDAARAAAG